MKELDLSAPCFQRLIMGLARIGRKHPQIGEQDPDKVQENLVLRSLLALPLLEKEKPIIDLGSGVGIPGLALALAEPERKVYLLEPRTKAVALLRWLISRLDCTNTEIIPARAEDTDFRKLKPAQVVTRSALNWQQIAACCPDSFDPRLRWSGPRVEPPPDSPSRIGALITVSCRGVTQQFYWWGKEKLFHVKQSTWKKQLMGCKISVTT